MHEKLFQYHPVIEGLVVTEGEDAGRIRDKENAHVLANDLNAAREGEANMIAQISNIEPSQRAEWMRSSIIPASQQHWLKYDKERVAYKIAEKVMRVPVQGRYLDQIEAGILVGEQLAQIDYRNK